ncbi:ribosome-associated translation inhibitor RaiA [bacterium]|nr:ribosome-associated translation inhibitor RaiA [bacterium]
MRININLKNIKSSDSVKIKINEKCQRVFRMFKKGISINWHSYFEDGVNYTEIDVNGPGANFHAKARAENLYKSFDLGIEKLEKQVNKRIEKVKNKMHKRKVELVILDPEDAWADYDEDYYSDAA